MDKIQLNFKSIYPIKEIEYNSNKIRVKTYLPIEEKLNIIEMVMQNSIEFNFVNPVKLETYLNAYVAIKYTNIDFSEYLDNIPELYNIIAEAGVKEIINTAIGNDYIELRNLCNLFIDKFEKYQNSLYGMVSQLFSDIPVKMAEAMEALGKLDMDKLQEVFKEVSAVGGSPAAIAETILGKDNK